MIPTYCRTTDSLRFDAEAIDAAADREQAARDKAAAARLRCFGCDATGCALYWHPSGMHCAKCFGEEDAAAVDRVRRALLVALARAASIVATGPRRCLTVEGVEVRGAA